MAQKPNTAQLPLPGPLKVLRAMYPVIDALIPSLAKKIGVGFFLKPFKFQLPDREKGVAKIAKTNLAKINGHDIAVYEWGNGKNYLLMVHGWSGRAMQFHALIEHFTAKGFRIVAFDAPGHGNSKGNQTNIVEFAECIKAIIADYGSPVALFGHSLGGIACMFYQKWNETRIPQVIINSPTLPDEIFENYAYRINGKKHRVEKWIRDHVKSEYNRDFDEVSGKELSKGLKQAPFLVVNDEDDREVSLRNAEILKENLPWAKFFVTQTFGHVRILRADVLINELNDFVESINDKP
ncbi:MAG: alpha/beta fold hydrolase [Bacteroidia bacterium]